MRSMIHTKYGQNNKDRDTPSLYHIMIMMHAIVVVISLLATRVVASSSSNDDKHEQAKFDLWLRGEFSFDTTNGLLQAQAPLRHGSVRDVRRRTARDMKLGGSNNKNGWASILNIRGGGSELIEEDAHVDIDKQLIELGIKFGQPFIDAIEQNKKDHDEDCKRSCEVFYCADDSKDSIKWNKEGGVHNSTTFASYSFGAVPPEDFSYEFKFPLDLIKVSEGEPLFSAQESAQVIKNAEEEGVDKNEYESGKYKLGGDWLVNLPNTRAWFNQKLEQTLFPLLHHLFPEIVRSSSVLRAHSVSLLKYNHTHPRTDVHIDNGILAMTLAMTPQSEYKGGGTFYEHMGVDNILPMDVGHGTFRPGSVRHGGHRVTSGTRYILGAFLLLEDHVENVRRLKNRGSELRTSGDLQGASDHFKWALALNPRCTTCLKDWAEILLSQKDYVQAESKIRSALEMLEGLDSDALFTLGLILSEQGKDDESIATYKKSIELNAEDAELAYNLGIKLGEKGDTKGELEMYKKEIDPHFGGAWINMGTTLAENGDLDSAELMFLKAIGIEEVKTKGMINLALTLQKKANNLAADGDLNGAKLAIVDAGTLLDDAKPLLDAKMALGGASAEDVMFSEQVKPLRIQTHRLYGQILAGMGDMSACEEEFRTACEKYSDVPGLWHALARVLELQGKTDEATKAKETLAALQKSM